MLDNSITVWFDQKVSSIKKKYIMTAQKETKDFENHVLNFALLSKGKVMSEDKSIELMKSNNKFDTIKESHILSVVKSVRHLNIMFNGKVWDNGYNANFEEIPLPSYGVKSAKSDIVLISNGRKYGFSIKMETDFVISSAQNKEEFNGIFKSSISKYEEENPTVDLSSLDPYIESISDVIGKVVTRPLKPTHFDNKKDGIHDGFINELYETIKNTFIEDENSHVRNSTKILIKNLESEINKFPMLMNYIIHEGLSAQLKYNGKLPCAEWVLSPTGCYDIQSPSSKFVTACAKVANIGVRGMCHGAMRSGAKKALKPFWNNKTVDMEMVYNKVNKMDMSLKWDVSNKKLMEVYK